VDCPDESKFAVVAKVAEQFRKTHNVIDVDGVRVLFDNGWGLLRASNTQPVLVMRFEASSDQHLGEYQREVEAALDGAKSAIGV
jgi:phosphomannomutase/phosphoglucomutase